MNDKATPKTPIRHLRRHIVEEITGLSRSTIYALMSKGQFPRPIRLRGKAVAWSEEDVAAWLVNRPQA
ncbi:MAG: helix-turn-helix transcriptional regulator [Paracoccaceae bacterium]